jgi:hypothetical protein
LLPWLRSEAWTQNPIGAVLEAGEAGIRGRTLILNLPGNRQLAALYLQTAARVLVPLLQMVQGRDPDEVLTSSDLETDQTVDAADEPQGADSHDRPGHRPSLREADFEAFLKRRRS